MRVYIWKNVARVSERYHSEGGVVVFAATETRARELANTQPECSIRLDEMPTHVRDVVDGDERVFIMPNAGCC